MLRIAICEDCPIQMEIIHALLDKYRVDRPGIEAQAYSFSSGEELIESVKNGDFYDLFLLDILLPGINGIELAKEVRERNEDVTLIFLTSSKDFALMAYGVSAFQYILKPVKECTLFPVLDRVLSLISQEKERFFMLSMTERTVKIPFSSIVSIELVKRALRVYLDNGSVLSGKCIREPFAMAIAPLLEDDRFLYAHKSFVLNMARAEELTGDSFKMENGILVPVPRYKYAEAKAIFNAYLAKR